MRMILMILSMTLLTGCLSLPDVAVTGTSTAGAVVGTALGGPVIGAVAGAGAGLATGAAIPEPTIEVNEIESFWQLLAYATQEFFNHLIAIGIVVGLLWFITGYIGLRMKRPEEKKLDQQLSKIIDKYMDK